MEDPLLSGESWQVMCSGKVHNASLYNSARTNLYIRICHCYKNVLSWLACVSIVNVGVPFILHAKEFMPHHSLTGAHILLVTM